MAFVVKFAKTIRNNWKKSVLFASLAAYGVHYGQGVYEDSVIRTAYCQEAKKYGELPLRTGERARKITVFLNPAAKKGKARKLFEKNVAPILYLSGSDVTVVRTEYEGQAKKYMDVLENTDAIIVAGGDGTLAEVVTGLLRREDEKKFSQIPIGVIPLGLDNNTLAKSIFTKEKSEAKWMLDATYSVLQGKTKPVDVMSITGDEGKKVFAVNSIEWGAFKEAKLRAKKYWYFGPLKHRFTYMLSTLGVWPPTVQGKLSYVLPCEGCSKCWSPPPKPQWRWWHMFLAPKIEVPQKDYSQVENDECGQIHEQQMSTVELNAFTANTLSPVDDQTQERNPQSIKLTLGQSSMDKKDFIKKGWKRIKENPTESLQSEHKVQEFTLKPEGDQQSHKFYIIDQEQYEMMPVNVQLLKNKLNVFCSLNS